MRSMMCICPKCGHLMHELEDEWFLCRECDRSFWYDDLMKMENKPYYKKTSEQTRIERERILLKKIEERDQRIAFLEARLNLEILMGKLMINELIR